MTILALLVGSLGGRGGGGACAGTCGCGFDVPLIFFFFELDVPLNWIHEMVTIMEFLLSATVEYFFPRTRIEIRIFVLEEGNKMVQV